MRLTVNTFNSRFDKFWVQGVKYDFKPSWLVPDTEQKKLESDNVFIY